MISMYEIAAAVVSSSTLSLACVLGDQPGNGSTQQRPPCELCNTVAVMQGGAEAAAVPAGELVSSPEPAQAFGEGPQQPPTAEALDRSPEPAGAVTGHPQQATPANAPAGSPEATDTAAGPDEDHQHGQSMPEFPAPPCPPGHAAGELADESTHTAALLELPSTAAPHMRAMHVPYACRNTASYMHVRRLLLQGGCTLRRHLRRSMAAWAPLAVPVAVMAAAVVLQVVTTAQEYVTVRRCYADYQSARHAASSHPSPATCFTHADPGCDRVVLHLTGVDNLSARERLRQIHPRATVQPCLSATL